MNTTPYLRDCHARGADTELFVVEGKSAANALNAARSRSHQAVFAMQGKIPNPQKVASQKVLANDHVSALFSTIGSGIGPHCKPENCQFGKILLLCDSDIDGLHSRSLLISLCWNFLQPLIKANRIGVLRAPAYRLPTLAKPAADRYLYSEREKLDWFKQCQQDQQPIQGLTHFKGIATMGVDEIFTLLLDKTSRAETNLTELPSPGGLADPPRAAS